MSPLLQFLHLAVLVGFAIAQPLYNLLSGQAEFFVARQNPLADIYLTVFFVSLVLPLLLLLLTRSLRLVSAAAQQRAYLCCVIGLVFCFCLIAIRQNSLATGSAAFVASFVVAVALGLLYRASAGARTLVTYMAPAILVFPAVFLWSDNIAMLRSPQVAASTGGAHAQASEGRYPPIVMVLFDELALNALLRSDGEIDAVRYPNFAALAGTSTWYRNATTVAPVTNYAVPAILSGRYPDTEALPVAAKYPQTLFSLLRDTHTLNIRETVTRLCPAQSCSPNSLSMVATSTQLLFDLSAVYGHMALPVQFSHWLPPLGHKWGGFVKAGNTQAKKDEYRVLESEVRKALREHLNSDRTRDINAFLDSLDSAAQGKPPLHFLHLLIPHRPWSYYPSGVMYTSGEGSRVPGMDQADVYWLENQALADQAQQRYLMQVALADLWLGQIVEKLKKSGQFAEALLVVVSDHGASFIAGDASRKLTQNNYPSVLPVPLFIKAPHQTSGSAHEGNVEITDILPTIAAMLDIKLTEPVDGRPIESAAVQQRATKRMYDFFSRWENKPLDVSAALEGRQAFIDQRVALFGEGLKGSVYDFGDYKEWFGKPVSNFETEPASLSLSIDQVALLQHVDLSSGFLPGLVTGTLPGAKDPLSPSVLLALNGVLRASAPLYRDGAGNWVYQAVLPESGFVQGHNVVEVFFVGANGSRSRLLAAGSSGASRFSLEEREGGASVVFEKAGEALPVVPGVVHGYVDTSKTLEHSLFISGWAIDPRTKRSVDKLMVFANGRGVYQVPHNALRRPDISLHHGVEKAGFSVLLPSSLLDEKSELEIRVVAVNEDGTAGELGYIEQFAWRPK